MTNLETSEGTIGTEIDQDIKLTETTEEEEGGIVVAPNIYALQRSIAEKEAMLKALKPKFIQMDGNE
jgi:hypothetical protein